VKKIRATGASGVSRPEISRHPEHRRQAVAAAVRLDVQMLTIHTSGGGEMMRAAEKSAQDTGEAAGPARAAGAGRDGADQFQQETLAEIGCAANVGNRSNAWRSSR
jgi:sugar phosphate isomerase/epimerase